MRFRTILFVLCTMLPGLAYGQNDGIPPIGTIDIYGHRTLTDEEVRDALGFKEGDYSLPQLDRALGPQLAREMGVARVQLDGTCCDENGNVLVFVGIDENGTANLRFRPEPSGDVRLPAVIYDTFLAFNSAVRTASLSTFPTEDLSEGHALITDPTARKEQDKFLIFGAENLAILKLVLRESSDRNHRAAAAYVIGYAPNKRDVVPDLVDASLDPFNSVRTNATRALGAIARLAANQPELGIDIPVDAFIDMMNSVIYADRKMGVTVLRRLSAGRKPDVLAALREFALPPLVEMSRWSYSGHSYAPYQILGRVVGMSEEEIESTFESGDKTAIERAMGLD
jgi:hypothetical protein